MKHDEIDSGDFAVDLLYPSQQKRIELKKRRNQLAEYPQSYLKSLELETVAKIISSYNVHYTMNIFSEMCMDTDVISYRLDILEDFLNVPTLSTTIKRIINVMIENDRKNIYKLSEPDSFDVLNDAITAFDGYIECMDIMHGFIEKHSKEIKSVGVRKMFDFFEENYRNKHFNSLRTELGELKESIRNNIRSVTVAINLDERMVPVSAGIINYSKDPYILKPSLFDKILYHGANFSKDKIVKNMRNKYINSEATNERIVNTADENLFKELSFITDKYIQMIDDVLAEYQKIGFKDMQHINYQLEYYMGAVNLIKLCENTGLKMCRPKLLEPKLRTAKIKGIFDLVYMSESKVWNLNHNDKRSVITNDIEFDNNSRMYILTGANNGGKTTFVRAIGICQVLAQAGLYVPAETCEISIADFIYTHFPKEEQIGIDASKFTSEIKEFKIISNTITPESLLLMNESIQSTTPNECIEISKELLKIFCTIGVRGILATHLIDLVSVIDEINDDSDIRSKVCSIVMTVDKKTGERLYKIKKDYPTKTSYSGTILSKFGIDMSEINNRLSKSHYV